MGEYFYTNMCSHLFEVTKRMLFYLMNDIWSCNFFIFVGIFTFRLVIFSYSVPIYLYSLWNYFFVYEYFTQHIRLKLFLPTCRFRQIHAQIILLWSFTSIKNIYPKSIYGKCFYFFSIDYFCAEICAFLRDRKSVV